MDTEAPAELIARARHNRAAFAEIYDLYLPRVYGFCRRYSRSREEAEDYTAETFERALRAIGRYQDRDLPLSTWLLRIARNAIINQARRSGRASPLEADTIPLDDASLEAWTEAHWLHTHIQALPHDQREVVRLRFYEDRAFRDVGERMGRSEGAAKQLLRRALKTLHLRIEGEREAAVNE